MPTGLKIPTAPLKQSILEDTVRFLFKLEVRKEQEVQTERSIEETHTNREEETVAAETPRQPTRRQAAKIGRNDVCWCGSGKKWKKCHYPDEG